MHILAMHLDRLYHYIDGTCIEHAACAKTLLQKLAANPARVLRFNCDPLNHNDVAALADLDLVRVEGQQVVLNTDHALIQPFM